jgi:ribosome-associated protein
MTSGKLSSYELTQLCCKALVEKKAENVRILKVADRSSVTDYMIIATGTSEPHLRALRVELHRALADSPARVIGVDTSSESGWTVVDLFDVMIHLFSAEARNRYKLENLWREAEAVSLNKVLGLPEKKEEVVAVKKPAKAKPAKAKPVKKVAAKTKVAPKKKAVSKSKKKAKVAVKAKTKSKPKKVTKPKTVKKPKAKLKKKR